MKKVDGLGITLIDNDGKKQHTFREFGLKWVSLEIGSPEAVTSYQQIPGSSYYLDLMKAVKTNNEPILGRRKIVAGFDCFGRMEEWSTRYSALLNFINGQEIKMILDTDPQFYYKGTVLVESQKEDYATCDYTLTLDADPYKYDMLLSTDDWLWDPFNFQTGIILRMRSREITAENNSILVPRGEVGTIPIIIVERMDNMMSVIHEGKQYSLKHGRNRIPQIRVGRKEVTLFFTGTGIVSIEFRRRLQ